MNARFLIALLLLVGPITGVAAQSIPSQCAATRGTYMVLADSGGWYGLLGVDTLNGLPLQNGTARISLSGFWSGTPDYSNLIHPDYTYHGNVYVLTYSINGQTYSYAQTVVIVQNYVTSTTTQTGWGSYVSTLQQITVSGLLAWSQPGCVSPGNVGSSVACTNTMTIIQ